MKIRQGFVSNSSSSSFVVAIPQDAALTVDYVHQALGVPPGSPMDKFSKDLSEYIVREAKKQSLEELADDEGYDSVEEFLKSNPKSKTANLHKQDYQIFTFYASNDSGDPFDMLLYEGGLPDVDTLQLKIIGDGC